MAPHARFKIYNGTSDAGTLIFDSSVDTDVVIPSPGYPVATYLDGVNLDGGTYGSWAVDLGGVGPPYDEGFSGDFSNPPADGANDAFGGSGYGDAGTYTPVLHFWELSGADGTDTFPITPGGSPAGSLVAALDSDGIPTSSVHVGDLVRFTLSGIDLDGETIQSWNVDLSGTGSLGGAGHTGAPTNGAVTTVVYGDVGSWTPTLQFFTGPDQDGTRFDVGTWDLEVLAASDPSGSMHVSDSTPHVGDTVAATLDTFDADGLEITVWSIQWGDGSDAVFTSGALAPGSLGTHEYAAPGSYEVQVHVSTDDVDFDPEWTVAVAFLDVSDGSDPDPGGDGTCPVVTLEVGDDLVVFDCATTDAAGNQWVWTGIPGWYEPPTPAHSSFPLGDERGETVTKSDWLPRTITLKAEGILANGGDLNAALDLFTRMASMLITPGRLTVNDNVPKYATVYLADVPRHSVRGESKTLEFEIPLIAYDVYRYRVSDDVGVL